MPGDPPIHPLKKLLVRLSFYPTHLFNRLMCLLGIWDAWNAVDDHVLVGVLPATRHLRRLKDLDVGGIINCCGEFRGHAELIAELGMEQLHLPMLDYHPPSEDQVRQGLGFINRQVDRGRKVYVHCKAGRGRSVTLVLCYLMTRYRCTAAEAYARVKSVRGQIDGNLLNRAVVRSFEAGQ